MPVRFIKIFAGPIGGFIFYLLFQSIQDDPTVSRMAGIATLMAIWWMTEAIPLAITSLVPVFLYPFLDIMSTKDIAPSYMNQVIFLFIGGFIIAFAMEKWNLHRRIALKIILIVGTDLNNILLGMMFSTYFLSMWISNTAATMMMLPTAFAVIGKVTELLRSKEEGTHYAKGILLGIAYSASIGGTATLIGTPPNLIFQSQYIGTFGTENAISFLQWFSFGLPVSLTLFFAAYFLLRKLFCSNIENIGSNIDLFSKEYESLGPISYEEKIVAVDFIILALLWFFRADINIGSFTIPGWSGIFDNPLLFSDSTVAILMASLLNLKAILSVPYRIFEDDGYRK